MASAHKLVSMANQIGKFFVTQPEADPASGIADHLEKFWDPSMRKAIIAHLHVGGEGMAPEVRSAVERLARGADVSDTPFESYGAAGPEITGKKPARKSSSAGKAKNST